MVAKKIVGREILSQHQKQNDRAYPQTITFWAEPSTYNKTPSKTAPMETTPCWYSCELNVV